MTVWPGADGAGGAGGLSVYVVRGGAKVTTPCGLPFIHTGAGDEIAWKFQAKPSMSGGRPDLMGTFAAGCP